MDLRLSAFIGGFTAFCVTLSTAAEISLKDDMDRTIRMRAPAQRIVTLAPFLTELVFDAGAGERVVGVSAYSDWPPRAKSLPQVGNAVNFSVEQIAALHPDLVLIWRDSMRPEDIERIGTFGATVFVATARTLEDVPRLLRVLGTLTAHDTTQAAAGYERKLERLRRDNARKPRVSVFLEIWNKPLTTISGRHFMNQALEICGADNVFKDLAGVAPVVSWEEVYLRNPAVIVGIGSGTTEPEFRANWGIRDTLSAVKGQRLIYVDPDRLQRPTARTPDGIAQLCAALDRVRPP